MLRNVSVALAAAIALLLVGLPNIAAAQDPPQKRENVRYYRVIHLNFKPGHNQAAWAILYGKIAPAVRAAS